MSQKSGPGWIRGTGRRDCPVGYPVKGNEPSNVYYEPGDPGYPQVIPEMCFEDAATAVRVGFTHVGGGGDAVPAAVPAGFLRATGGRECPTGYPIKGNEPSNVFYRPEDPGYAQVIPEVCFADIAEAEKAGFTRVKHEAAKKTEPVAAVRKEEPAVKKEEVAAAGVAAAGVAAAKAVDAKAEAPKAAEAARVAAPPPPPPPPPPPAPVAEASGGGWMKWLLPLLALAALAAGIWYFTRDDDDEDVTPTVAATVAATIEAEAEGSVEAIATDVVEAEGSVEAAGAEGTAVDVVADIEGTVEADVAAAEGSAAAVVADVEGTVEASGIEGTVESAVGAVEGSVEAGVGAVEGTAEVMATSAAGTVEAGVAAVETGVADGEATVEAAMATGVASPEASPAASPVAGDGITLIAKDIAYDPKEITIQASDLPVTIILDNTGAAEHNFVIDSLDIEVTAAPGTSAEIVIPAGTAAGTYEFYCSIPGHKEAGMVGTLVVQ